LRPLSSSEVFRLEALRVLRIAADVIGAIGIVCMTLPRHTLPLPDCHLAGGTGCVRRMTR
jgi:hypothetical protein